MVILHNKESTWGFGGDPQKVQPRILLLGAEVATKQHGHVTSLATPRGQVPCAFSPDSPGASSAPRSHCQVFVKFSVSPLVPPSSCSKSVFCFHSQ